MSNNSKKLEPIFNGCGIEAQDSMCTNQQDTACPNRSDDGVTCTDCLVDCEEQAGKFEDEFYGVNLLSTSEVQELSLS